jgi:TetR/AcrR family transcriptional repressor of nem operon
MAGVKQFDRDEVLDRAMAAFWTRGYEATSIDDLVEATGIGRGSLYSTFGDKRQLFLAALDRYWNTVGMEMFAELSDPDPRHAIERMFDALIRRASNQNFREAAFSLTRRLSVRLTKSPEKMRKTWVSKKPRSIRSFEELRLTGR